MGILLTLPPPCLLPTSGHPSWKAAVVVFHPCCSLPYTHAAQIDPKSISIYTSPPPGRRASPLPGCGRAVCRSLRHCLRFACLIFYPGSAPGWGSGRWCEFDRMSGPGIRCSRWRWQRDWRRVTPVPGCLSGFSTGVRVGGHLRDQHPQPAQRASLPWDAQPSEG